MLTVSEGWASTMVTSAESDSVTELPSSSSVMAVTVSVSTSPALPDTTPEKPHT